MKKLFVLFILGISVPALAEIVSTVSFNPSRIGTYEYLKISRDANFKGGLETPTLNVQPSGEVTMRWDNANTTEKYYNVPTVTGNANTSVDMPHTTFLQDSELSPSEINYSADSATDPGYKIPNITMLGGSLSFGENTTNKDSYVAELSHDGGQAQVQFYAEALNESTLNISGNTGKSVALTADGTAYTAKDESADTAGADSTYTRGFHLAGVDIPYPAGDYVQKTGTTSLSDTAALCWVQRCTTEGKVAWVLSLVNGSCPATKTNISCGGSEEEPSGNCSTQSYKIAHKSECCPSAEKTDTDCYKLGWVLDSSGDRGGGQCEGQGCGESMPCTYDYAPGDPCSLGESCHVVDARPEDSMVVWWEEGCDYINNGW